MEIKRCFREISAETEKRTKIVEESLEKCPPGRMREDRHVNKYYLIRDYYEKGKRRTHSLTKDNEMLGCLIKKELYQKELESLKSIQKVMDYASRNLVEFDMSKAVSDMAAKYPHLPEERILAALAAQGAAPQPGQLHTQGAAPQPGQLHTQGAVPQPGLSSMPGAGRAASWANENYERSTYRQEDLKQITTRGLKVRSKSEVLIAEKLGQYNQQFHYEQVLHFNGFTLVPDFTIRRADGKLFYWEHMGLTSNRDYIDRQMKKLQQYASVNIVPWDNLIITFDNEGGMIDLRRVEFEIQNRLL